MPIVFYCPRCKGKIKAPDLPGRQVRCPDCKELATIPKGEAVPPVEAALPDEPAGKVEPRKYRTKRRRGRRRFPWANVLGVGSIYLGILALSVFPTLMLVPYSLPLAALGWTVALTGMALSPRAGANRVPAFWTSLAGLALNMVTLVLWVMFWAGVISIMTSPLR